MIAVRMSPSGAKWPGLSGPHPEDSLVELAERLTGVLTELEVVRLLAEEVERRVHPTHWCLLVGDRDSLRVEHVGGGASASLLRACFEPGEGPVWRALDKLETQVLTKPSPSELISISGCARPPIPEDAVAIPFGGFEVLGCLEMVDALRVGPSGSDLHALRRAMRLGGVGIRNARRHVRLSRGDTVDELTGLAGPNRFRAALDAELERAKRSQRPPAVILVDIDHFKQVNAAHGRLVGSSLLAEVGAVLQLSIRRIDLASRWTGDTFALLLPETDREGARRVAGRLLERLRTAQIQLSVDAPLDLTASAGIALFGEPGSDPERLIHEAEAAMRAAQSSGKTEAVVFADGCD